MPAVANYYDPSIEFYTSFAEAIEEVGILDTFNDNNAFRLEISVDTVVDTDYRRMAHKIVVRMYDLENSGKALVHVFTYTDYETIKENGASTLYHHLVCNTIKDMFKQITEG